MNEIVEAVFQYLALMRKEGPQRNLFQECAVCDVNFALQCGVCECGVCECGVCECVKEGGCVTVCVSEGGREREKVVCS